jgi:VWFA-related protein
MTPIVFLAISFVLGALAPVPRGHMGGLAPVPAPGDSFAQARQTDTRNREVYVSVVDGSGKAAQGLTVEDFSVREDGVAREVVKVEPATDPLTISVLVDDSQAATDAIPYLRDGLKSFVERLNGKAEIALATIGERPTSIVDYTTSTEALNKGIGRIFARPGSGAYLLEGIVEVSRGLQRREAKRPVIVALTMEGVEFSNRYYEPVLDDLKKSGATLHVLAIGTPSDSQADEMRNRNIVIAEGTQRTGGRRDQLLSVTSINDKLKQLADELLNQYVVTYARPETLIPPEKMDVSVKRRGLTARARTRTAGR